MSLGESHWYILLWFVIIVPIAYLLSMNSIFALSILLFSAWLNLEFLELFKVAEGLFILNLGYGICVYALGGLHEIWEPMKKCASSFRFAGAAFILAVTLILTTIQMTQLLDRNLTNIWFLVALFAFSGIAVLASITSLFLNRGRDMHLRIIESVGSILLLIFAFFYLWCPINVSLMYYLLFNFIMLAVIICFAYIGLKTRKKSLVDLAILSFSILLLMRYFDYFWDFMDKSLFMLLAGVLLLGGGYLLEKKRRELLKQIDTRPNN